MRQPFRDPVFGTCIVRVTDRRTDLAAGDASEGLKNEYSRVQAFNADGSRILVRGTAGTWYLYDARTLQPVRELPIDFDPRWDAKDPNLIYYSSGTALVALDATTGDQRLVHDFAADFPGRSLAAVWMRHEGSPSADGRYWGLMAEDENWLTIALLVYDLWENRVVAVRERDPSEIDSVSISPLGNYLLAYEDTYCEPGKLGDDAQPCGLMVYDRELQNGRGLLRLIGHSDLALDAQGREVLVYQDIDTDHISMLDLETGVVTALWPIDFSHTPIGLHISGRGFECPGWALISTHDGDPGAYTWMDDQVFAIELRPNGGVVRLAHTHSLVDPDQEHDYWAEPQATTNPDFTRILFTSNWGRLGTAAVETFLIELPGGLYSSIGTLSTVSPEVPQPAEEPASSAPIHPASSGAAGSSGRTSLFFLHHSTGEGLISGGDIRGVISRYNEENGTEYEFWDHGYNEDGLRDAQGEHVGTYGIPDDNTDPEGLFNLWTTDNAARRQMLANHEVIAFKSCFPASDIQDDAMLAQYRQWYLAMRAVFDQHPETVFVVMSPPPLHHLATDSAASRRARQFANWLKSGEYLGGHPNMACFDLFGALARPDDGSAGANMLRHEYETDHADSDSHPNAAANEIVGPLLCLFLLSVAQSP